MGNPATIRAAPSTRAIGNSGGAKCQCVRYQGTYTASVPGAMTRNIAEPMIAAARCTIGAYSTPPRIVRIGRALASRDVLREVLVAFELCQAGRRRQCLGTGVMLPTIRAPEIAVRRRLRGATFHGRRGIQLRCSHHHLRARVSGGLLCGKSLR